MVTFGVILFKVVVSGINGVRSLYSVDGPNRLLLNQATFSSKSYGVEAVQLVNSMLLHRMKLSPITFSFFIIVFLTLQVTYTWTFVLNYDTSSPYPL